MADLLRQWMDPRRSWEYRLLRLKGGRPVLQTRRRDETDWSEHRTISQAIAEEFARACEEAAPPADPLAEALESERLRAALVSLLDDGFECCDEWVLSGHEQDAYTDHDPDCTFAVLIGPADPSPLRRLLAALSRLDSTASGDGEAFNAALDAVIEAGGEVRGVLGGEVER